MLGNTLVICCFLLALSSGTASATAALDSYFVAGMWVVSACMWSCLGVIQLVIARN